MPVNDSSRKFSRLTPTTSGFKNHGSSIKTGYRCVAPFMAASRDGLSCSLRPFLNHRIECCGTTTGGMVSSTARGAGQSHDCIGTIPASARVPVHSKRSILHKP